MRRDTFDRMFPLHRGENLIKGPMIAADHLAILLERDLGEVCRDGNLLAEGLLHARDEYDSDFIIVFSDVAVDAEAFGVELEYFPNINPQPATHLKSDEFRIVDIPSSGRFPELFKAAEICRKELDKDFPIFMSMKEPFTLAAMAHNPEIFLSYLISEPSLAKDMIEICCENQIKTVKAITEAGFIPFIGAPISSADMIGPRYFAEFVEPYLTRLRDAAREAGSFACLHICGNVKPLSERLIALNLDLLSIEDRGAIFDFRETENTILMGVISTNLFIFGNENQVKDAARDCKEIMPEPFVLSTGCDIPAKAKSNLVKAMMSGD